jgi:hypothetical protein
MEQELIWVLDWYMGLGASALMFFFTCAVVGIIIYVVCYLLWLLHIFATIRRRYYENVWWADYDRDIEELTNE